MQGPLCLALALHPWESCVITLGAECPPREGAQSRAPPNRVLMGVKDLFLENALNGAQPVVAVVTRDMVRQG